MALFGEKYGDEVRTVKISDFSFELCGGTHIDNTSEIKCFKIISESGVASGIRRIEAITSDTLISYYNDEVAKLDSISALLKVPASETYDKVNNLLNDVKELKSEVDSLKKQLSVNEVSDINVEKINGLDVVINNFSNKNMDELKNLADSIKEKNKDYVVILLSKNSSGVSIVVSISDTAISKGLHAGNILKQLAVTLGGNGGGKDKFAQGQGRDASKIDEAIALARKVING